MSEEIAVMQRVEKKKTTKKIFVSKLSESQASLGELVSSMGEESDERVYLKRMRVLEQENGEMSRKIAQILADYEDLKY